MLKQPKFKICRRLGSGVYEKCQTQKFTISEGRKAQTGKRPKARSDYGNQLIEKQKIRFSYGVSERQFANYVKAALAKGGGAAERLFESLESRLDNVVYRLGIASTRRLGRQMVSHGHITVNGKKLTVPSYSVKVGDVVKVRDGSQSSPLFQNLEKKIENYVMPEWLKFDPKLFSAEVKGAPKNPDAFLDINTVLQFYTR